MDQEKEGSIPNFPSMEDKSRVKSRSSLELWNKGAYEGGLMVWKSRIPWAKQPLPQTGPVPELGAAGTGWNPRVGELQGLQHGADAAKHSAGLRTHHLASASVYGCATTLPAAASLCLQEGIFKGRWAANEF